MNPREQQTTSRLWMATSIGLLLFVAPSDLSGQQEPGEGGGGGNCGVDCLCCAGSPDAWVGGGSCSECHGSGYATNYCRYGSCLTCNFLSTGEAAELQVVIDALNRATPDALTTIDGSHRATASRGEANGAGQGLRCHLEPAAVNRAGRGSGRRVPNDG
jgi:hypothetical protein